MKGLYEWLKEHRPETELVFLSSRRRPEYYATVRVHGQTAVSSSSVIRE